MKKITFLLLAVGLLVSCNSDTKKRLPNSVGAINTLYVVIDDDLWKGEVGDKIREHFTAPVIGLPIDEPLFTLNQISPDVFSGFVTHGRNIFIIKKDSTNGFTIQEDIYATPQQVIYITGKTNEDLKRIIDKKAPEYIPQLKASELKENQKRFTQSLNKETVLQEKFGIKLTMPSVYRVAKQEDNFVWIRRETKKGNMSVLVYELPLNYFPKDTITVEKIIKMRDSIGEKHIPGREEGMYMITEKAYAPYVFNAEIATKPAIETRGMWEVKNFFMAGPFINYMIKDQENNRTLVIEGFTFAPSIDKRDIMFELDAILQSIKFL